MTEFTATYARACHLIPRVQRCAEKSGQTKPSPKVVAGPPSRARMKYDPIFPQPEGPGPIFPISASIVASRHPVCVTPHSLNSKKLAPGAAPGELDDRP